MTEKNDPKASAALVIGIIALVISVYSAISVTQMNLEEPEMEEAAPINLVEDLDDKLEEQIVAVIENFIAGGYVKPIQVGEGSGLMTRNKRLFPVQRSQIFAKMEIITV